MNYSENLKRREERRERMNRRFRRMFTVALVMGFLIGFFIGRLTSTAHAEETPEAATPPVVESEGPEILTSTIPEISLPPVPEKTLLGEYRITAYCACEKCCGVWALNRPDGIVYGAAGIELKAGVSCASPLPFGTVVEVEGLGEYIVQDRTAAWVVEEYGENLIDIYFDSHEAACEFGLKYRNVYVKEDTNHDQM